MRTKRNFESKRQFTIIISVTWDTCLSDLAYEALRVTRTLYERMTHVGSNKCAFFLSNGGKRGGSGSTNSSKQPLQQCSGFTIQTSWTPLFFVKTIFEEWYLQKRNISFPWQNSWGQYFYSIVSISKYLSQGHREIFSGKWRTSVEIKAKVVKSRNPDVVNHTWLEYSNAPPFLRVTTAHQHSKSRHKTVLKQNVCHTHNNIWSQQCSEHVLI